MYQGWREQIGRKSEVGGSNVEIERKHVAATADPKLLRRWGVSCHMRRAQIFHGEGPGVASAEMRSVTEGDVGIDIPNSSSAGLFTLSLASK